MVEIKPIVIPPLFVAKQRRVGLQVVFQHVIRKKLGDVVFGQGAVNLAVNSRVDAIATFAEAKTGFQFDLDLQGIFGNQPF
jgi:Na+/phosphate symporter